MSRGFFIPVQTIREGRKKAVGHVNFSKGFGGIHSMSKWTFVTNHALVLVYLANHPRITALEMSLSIGITERAVRKIIADLEAEGYISKEKEGRRVNYSINKTLRLRHQTQRDKSIKKLLEVLGWEEKRKK